MYLKIFTLVSGCFFLSNCGIVYQYQCQKKYEMVWDRYLLGFPSEKDLKHANYGPNPKQSVLLALESNRDSYLDPYSYKYKITGIRKGWVNETPEQGLKNIRYGWFVDYYTLAKNRFGAYTGWKGSGELDFLGIGANPPKTIFASETHPIFVKSELELRGYGKHNYGFGTEMDCSDVELFYEKATKGTVRKIIFYGGLSDTREKMIKKAGRES